MADKLCALTVVAMATEVDAGPVAGSNGINIES